MSSKSATRVRFPSSVNSKTFNLISLHVIVSSLAHCAAIQNALPAAAAASTRHALLIALMIFAMHPGFASLRGSRSLRPSCFLVRVEFGVVCSAVPLVPKSQAAGAGNGVRCRGGHAATALSRFVDRWLLKTAGCLQRFPFTISRKMAMFVYVEQ